MAMSIEESFQNIVEQLPEILLWPTSPCAGT